ncbi:MAG TPA: MFS transporter [Phycisphaerae bacterium]|nr:MFS transporter [Phycisphaerae bacterium]
MSRTPSATGDERLYTLRFFKVFGGVVLFMTGVALQFHFGQYIQHLGHGVDTLGMVLGISMVGTLLIRLHIGRWIDRFGCRPIWVVGAMAATLGAGAIQFTGHLWLIVLLRALTTMAAAAVMTTVAVIAAHVAPPRRRAESLGSMGLGGFTGMIIGATLGDYIFSAPIETILPYRVFFSTSAACSLLSGTVLLLIALPAGCGPAGSHGDVTAGPGPAGPSTLRVICTHWPGTVLLVGLVFSMVFCLQTSFLERLAEARGFYNIKAFFLTYGPTAIILRIVFRRVPERIGRTRSVVGGMLLLGTGVALLTGVQTQWGLIAPALLMGAGHCFVFPSMVDLAAERLPADRRGTGTSLILAAGDLGMLTGFVGLGEVIDRLGYDAALWALVAAVLTAAIVFGVSRRDAVLGRTRRAAVGHP